jgi:hypothetical protein
VRGFVCATCGKFHDTLPMSFGPAAPEHWFQIATSNRLALRLLHRIRRFFGWRVLGSDQCIVDGKYFYILGRIQIPVLDSEDTFTWLAWVSLSKHNFDRACELWHTPGREHEPPYFGWLSSTLPCEPPTLHLKVNIHTRPVGERPYIELEPTDHPLAIEQRQGISLARVQQIAEEIPHAS